MKKARFFITGMGGMAGRALAKLSIESGYHVGGTVHINNPQELNNFSKEELAIYQVNLTDARAIKEVIQDFSPNIIIHLAGKAFGRYDKQALNPSIYNENVSIIQNVVSASLSLPQRPRFILSSGCLIYGKNNSAEYLREIETNKLQIINRQKDPYRAGRLEQEKILVQQDKLDYVIGRPTQFTGPGKIPGVVEYYIAKEISELISRKKKLLELRNKCGEVDMLDVRDVAKAYLLLAEKGQTRGIYHISSQMPINAEQLAKIFMRLVGLNPELYEIKSTSKEEVIYCRFSSEKLRKLGWLPQFSLDKALYSYWEFFQKNTQRL